MSNPPRRLPDRPQPVPPLEAAFEGPVATLAADFDENAGLRPGYKLKLNSYDLGVDIELHDAINRIRFEHPEVRTVVVTSAKDRCSARAPTSSCWACPATPGR
jgi:benzoyl-CoA-dihydrodiol lyase